MDLGKIAMWGAVGYAAFIFLSQMSKSKELKQFWEFIKGTKSKLEERKKRGKSWLRI